MPTDAAGIVDAVQAARTAWEEFQERVAELKQALRASASPDLAFELARIEAYDALVGRDEGMGLSMTGWLDEIERAAGGDPG